MNQLYKQHYVETSYYFSPTSICFFIQVQKKLKRAVTQNKVSNQNLKIGLLYSIVQLKHACKYSVGKRADSNFSKLSK